MNELNLDKIKQNIEAILFASHAPVKLSNIKAAVGEGITPSIVKKGIQSLNEEYNQEKKPYEIEEVANGFRMSTKPEYFSVISKIEKRKSESKLSNAALETLSIVAYKQPVNRATIEAIRGVQTGPILRALMEKGLIKIAGKEDVPGSPVLYATTDKFLEILGLKNLNELPSVEELK